MRTSVLIIAHNEEKHIAKCISSVLNQTQKPDEIILIAHNCTDKTIEIAQKFPIIVFPFNGAEGIVNARTEGLNKISGDIIICIDGDSFAKDNWVEIMTKTLQNNNILVGSWVKFNGTIFGGLANMFNKYLCISKNKKAISWIWGPSFALWNKDKNLVKEILKKSVILSKELSLSRNPEDYWLALFMSKHGNLEVTNKTWIAVYTKEVSSLEIIIRTKENLKNDRLIKSKSKEINFI